MAIGLNPKYGGALYELGRTYIVLKKMPLVKAQYNALLNIDQKLAADLWSKYTAAGGK